ncbi:MAG TPA: HAD-IIIC family phosphatase [Candidatus Nanoarchaeia archaeon]|nr:HAD-IIIC family phosphatase [Candidatus Nanoarchaeia archaeon]
MQSDEALPDEKISALITDLDNTLWDGILAEKQHLALRKQYYELLKTLYKKGISLFVVSKNDPEYVEEAFHQLGIDKNLFVALLVNWDPKYLTIERLLQHTELRPETVVYVDDNPFERNEAKTKIPTLFILDDKNWQLLLTHPIIQKKKEQLLSEIQERQNRYRTALLSSTQKNMFKDDLEFLHSLKRELSIGKVPADNLDRVTRLLVETHRINFNPDKLTQYETALGYLHEQLNEGDELYAISTRENNISLGLTGALLVHYKGKKAQITDGTFSCGIIGRDFEPKSLLALIQHLQKREIEQLEVFVTPTSTNQRVREILQKLGFSEKGRTFNQSIYSLQLQNYTSKEKYDWISLSPNPPELDYAGHLSITSFFENHVKPLIQQRWKITNLGSARGEVLGHLQKEVRSTFYRFLEKKQADYTKIDLEHYPEENNVVANAENLSGIIVDETQDLVMAIELLEHTEHFWKVIQEMIRICKKGGYLFVTVPSYNYPKHEYPIDLWRIGPKTLSSFFPLPPFTLIRMEAEGHQDYPRRTLILVQKNDRFSVSIQPPKGETNWKTGLTLFP